MTDRSPPPPPRRRKASPDEPARAGRPRAVAEIVPAVGAASFRRFGFVQSSIVSRWAEIVGERYAGVSAPESIRFPTGRREGGVLNLVVESAHAPMMQHVGPAIVERVNRFFGYDAVARLAIRHGAAQRRTTPRTAAPAGPVPAALGDSLKAIGDPELKTVLENLARGLGQMAAPPLKLGKIG